MFVSNRNIGNTQVIGIILCRFPNFSIIYSETKFIIIQVTRLTPSHQVPSSYVFGFKRLGLNLLNIVTLLTLKVIIGDHPNRLKTISTIFKPKKLKSTLKETGILLSKLSVHYLKNISQLIHRSFVHVSITILKRVSKKDSLKFFQQIYPTWKNPAL